MIYKSDDLFLNLGLLYWPFIQSHRIPFGHLLILLSLEENDSREFTILRCARNRGSMSTFPVFRNRHMIIRLKCLEKAAGR